jgi:hypothetical protein
LQPMFQDGDLHSIDQRGNEMLLHIVIKGI